MSYYRQHLWGPWALFIARTSAGHRGFISRCARAGCYARRGLSVGPHGGLVRSYRNGGPDQKWELLPPTCKGQGKKEP